MKIPNPKITTPKLSVKIPGMKNFAEPRWERAVDTLRRQIAGVMTSGKSYDETITPTLQTLESLLPKVPRIS